MRPVCRLFKSLYYLTLEQFFGMFGWFFSYTRCPFPSDHDRPHLLALAQPSTQPFATLEIVSDGDQVNE